MVDIRQTQSYANYLVKVGWIVKRINGVNYFIRKLPLIGAVIKVQRPEQFNNSTVQRLASKYHAIQIIVEPNDVAQSTECIEQGYRLSRSPYLPTKTLLLKLILPMHRCISSMKKDARRAIDKNSKLQILNYKLENLEEFRNAWIKAVGWKRHVPHLKNLQALKKSFGEKSLFTTSRNGNSGAIFLIGSPSTAYYWQAFTDKEGRKNLEQYKIVWEGMRWAKNQGVKVFDFEGIYDERFPNKSWLGFTHFKKSFGGREVEYPGCFTSIRFAK